MYDTSSEPIASGTDFIWKDLSGNNNNVALKNFNSDKNTWYSQDGILFDGIDDYGLIGKHNYSYVTVSAVVSMQSFKNSEADIIVNYEGGGYGLNMNGSNVYRFQTYINGAYRMIVSGAPTLNRDYVLTGVYDGSNVLFYVDGQKLEPLSISGTISAPGSNTYLMLGANPTGQSAPSGFANMKLKNIKLYNRALTEEEVLKNYQVDAGRFNLK